jgi:hypothetical protein
MNCDYCGKKTAALEDLDYCSVCIDCLGEIDENENDKIDNFFKKSDSND